MSLDGGAFTHISRTVQPTNCFEGEARLVELFTDFNRDSSTTNRTRRFMLGKMLGPKPFQVDCCVDVAVNLQKVLLIPIVSNTAIGKDDFIPIAENH